MSVYVVTGWMRSGTSMMMDCLAAGGLPTLKSDRRNGYAAHHADEYYHPNPNGLHELTPEEYRIGGFEKDKHAVKVVAPWLPWLKRCDKAILMLRDPEEIRQSYEAFVGQQVDARFVEQYEHRMQRCREYFAGLGASLIDVPYRDVLNEPLRWFGMLADRGWPIDDVAAAGVVDQAKCGSVLRLHRYRCRCRGSAVRQRSQRTECVGRVVRGVWHCSGRQTCAQRAVRI